LPSGVAKNRTFLGWGAVATRLKVASLRISEFEIFPAVRVHEVATVQGNKSAAIERCPRQVDGVEQFLSTVIAIAAGELQEAVVKAAVVP
jgi:hypothetical protein